MGHDIYRFALKAVAKTVLKVKFLPFIFAVEAIDALLCASKGDFRGVITCMLFGIFDILSCGAFQQIVQLFSKSATIQTIASGMISNVTQQVQTTIFKLGISGFIASLIWEPYEVAYYNLLAIYGYMFGKEAINNGLSLKMK